MPSRAPSARRASREVRLDEPKIPVVRSSPSAYPKSAGIPEIAILPVFGAPRTPRGFSPPAVASSSSSVDKSGAMNAAMDAIVG